MMFSVEVSASSIYSDNFTGNDNICTYSGMQAGYVIAGSSEICAKASDFASATYKLSDASFVSAMFYTPIYPTAIENGDTAIFGCNSFVNVLSVSAIFCS